MLQGEAMKAAGNGARFIERVLFLAAFVAFGYVGLAALDRFAFQRIESAQLARFVPTTVAPTRDRADRASRVRLPAPATGDVIGRLTIPAAGIDAVVAEGVDSRTLRRAIGHIPNTALPGASGNVALAGHRDTFFHDLEKLHLNDSIRLVTPAGTYDYAVEDIRIVEPTQTDVLAPDPSPSLTLVTCYPFDYIGTAPLRYIIRASEIARSAVGAASGAPAGH